jgi:sarcosine oxidase/sarcosine oxidase subunit beta
MKHVSIVGGGIAGLLTAWALSRRGVKVTVFEQGPLPNPQCSSFDEHRIIRHAYGAMQGYARLMPEAFSLWDRVWGDIFPAGQQRGYLETGLTYVVRGDNGWYGSTAQSLDELGVAYNEVPLDAAPGYYPMLNCDGVTRVVETGGAGVLFPSIIMTALVAALPGMGVHFVPSCTVGAVDADAGEVVANGERHRADAVVIAAGAWVDRLVPALKGIAVPSRQAVVYLAPPSDLASAWATAPAIITRDFKGEIGGTYTLPPRQGMRLKVGDHLFSRRGNPDDDRVARPEDLEVLLASLPLVYHDFGRYTILERRACFYTVTEDERFIVRPIGDRAWAISACSGHGFKLAPVMALAVAQALTGERDAADIPAWAAPA